MSDEKPAKTLASYLGTWQYTHASADRFYKVVPHGSMYKITWGETLASLDSTKRAQFVTAEEAFRRIRSKARGGYTLETPYAGVYHDSALLEVADLYANKPKQTAKKKSEPKKKFSFAEWLSER